METAVQTNKKHQRIFLLACLALAVLLGWPSSSRADNASDYAAGVYDGYSYEARWITAPGNGANGASDAFLAAYHATYDHADPSSYLNGTDVDYQSAFNYCYPLCLHYFTTTSDAYQSAFDLGRSAADDSAYNDPNGLPAANPYSPPVSADSYTLTVAPFTGVVSQSGSFINLMISRFGIPAILISIGVAGWLFVKRIAKSAFH